MDVESRIGAPLVGALFAIVLGAMVLGGCSDDADEGGLEALDGETLYREPIADGNAFACATCHAIEEPAEDGVRRAGHALGGATRRGSWKSGQVNTLREAVNSCLDEWMAAEPWPEGDPRQQALESWLDAQQGGPEEPFEIRIVQPPSLGIGLAETGRGIFNTSCSICHGQDGVGSGLAPAVVRVGLEQGYVAERIRLSGAPGSPVYEGLTGGRMPFWASDRLSDLEVRHVVAYVTEEPRETGEAVTGEVGEPGSCESTHSRVGQVATLATFFHGVAGEATIVDDCTIRIDNFVFDGNGIDVQIYGGLGGDYDGGFSMTGDLFNFPLGYEGATVYATLPEDKSLDDLDGISVWCVDVGVDFGSGTFGPP